MIDHQTDSKPMMKEEEIEKAFQYAKDLVDKLSARKFTNRFSIEEKKLVYALFKQATVGDCPCGSMKRPSLFDLLGRAKYDSWMKQKGKEPQVAMYEYVAVVEAIKNKHLEAIQVELSSSQ